VKDISIVGGGYLGTELAYAVANKGILSLDNWKL
jgi:folate-dependent tRNA-U54 methylase TrmFO/GidA